MKAVVVGAGLIGSERIIAVDAISKATNGQVSLAYVVDPDADKIKQVSQNYGVVGGGDLDAALALRPDWVFVCMPHDLAKSTMDRAFVAGANVFVEKPLGRSLKECQSILANKPANKKVSVGFNYRFFAGIEAALSDAAAGLFGNLISVSMVLGHGNAPGMEKSWKLDPEKCGGGCLIDPGVHLMDLALHLSKGSLQVNGGNSWSGFWKTGIEEEAHCCLSDESGVIFNLQVSLNRWRSHFRLEINGTEGYGVVEGRGRSYGPQTYRTGRRWGWQSGKSQGDSEIVVIAADPCQDSFLKETASLFGADISQATLGELTRSRVCDEAEGISVMRLLDGIREHLGLPIASS